MFTGLYPNEHGVVAMDENRAFPAVPSLPEVLSGSGYRTAAFTGGGNMSAHFGFDRGFDSYRSLGRRFEDSVDAALDWIGESNEPFFLLLHGFDAHKPYKSTPEDRRALGLDPERARGMPAVCEKGDRAAIEPFLADYDAAIRRGDRALGRFFAELSRRTDSDRVVVVFTSDHGEEFLEHGGCFHVRTLYREVLHVPLFFRVPGLARRRVVEPVAASVSVAPTVLDLVGVERGGIGGPSLLGVLAGRAVERGPIVSETSSRIRPGGAGGHLRSLTAAREKLIDQVSEGRSEYFDLARDPGELRGTVGTRHARRLGAVLGRWLREHPPVAEPDEAAPLPAKLERELRALGYLSD